MGDDCAAIPDGEGHLLFAIEGFINQLRRGRSVVRGLVRGHGECLGHRLDGRMADRRRGRDLG